MIVRFVILLLLIALCVTAQLDVLVTRKRNGNFVPILNKNGVLTRNYRGGIYIARDNGGRFEPVHKAMENGWLQQPNVNIPRRRGRPRRT